MNFIDLIVEFVKQGSEVELPGMGTLTSSNVAAHHDAASGTYYPERRTVVMNNSQTGSKDIINFIAEKECVTPEIAEQMWKNFVGALDDKLRRTPSGHEFPGIGTMRRVGNRCVFEALEGLDLDADKRHEVPLENVATYVPKDIVDPFAAFDKPAAPAPQPEPVAEPQPVVETPAPAPEPAPEPVFVAPTPEPQPVVEAPAPKVEAVAAPIVPPTADHLSEVKKMLDEIPSSQKDAKEVRRAEKAAAKAEKEARKAAEEAEKEAAKKAAIAAKAAEKAAKEAEKNAKEAEKKAAKEAKKSAKEQAKAKSMAMPTVNLIDTEAPNVHPATEQEKEETKTKKRHWWILILLLLLFLGGGGYYYATQMDGFAAKRGTTPEKVEHTLIDQFTGDRNLLKFETTDVNRSVSLVHEFMADYVHQFLAARHYGNAFVPMMQEIDTYANDRLKDLMVEGYCVKRFFPYDDFWMERNYEEYKEAGAQYYRCQVQGELMDIDFLEKMLDDIVSSLGLHADGFGLNGLRGNGYAAGGKGTAQTKPAAAYEEVVPEAPTLRNSKQGFDLIAGFFTSKKSANKCANQLKALGSDAYIISKSGGYYVSMGSAPTYTAAQAMEKHIKSWYKSDISIKNFNE